MKNHITANVEFYYKGEKLTASIEIDIDHYMQTAGRLPDLYPLLAQTINLDPYSYEYEMMQVETIFFSNATGLTIGHVNEGAFDFKAFENAWLEDKLFRDIQDIAQKILSVDNLDEQPNLKKALVEAYRLGQKTSLTPTESQNTESF